MARPSGSGTCAQPGAASCTWGGGPRSSRLPSCPTPEKPAILRAYLRKWKFEVGVFFNGVEPDATDAELLAIAPGYPVFRITMTGS